MSTAVGAGSSALAEEKEGVSQPKAREIEVGGARWHCPLEQLWARTSEAESAMYINVQPWFGMLFHS